MVLPLLDACGERGLRVALHVEPYKGRTAESVKEDLRYAKDRYAAHPAFHRMHRRTGRAYSTAAAAATTTTTAAMSSGVASTSSQRAAQLEQEGYLPVFFIYDSYHVSPQEWGGVLSYDGRAGSIRGDPALDAFLLFLFVEAGHQAYVSHLYTKEYFNGSTTHPLFPRYFPRFDCLSCLPACLPACLPKCATNRSNQITK